MNLKFVLIYQILKKEVPLNNTKNAFYNNFEMQQRRELSADQFSSPPNINMQATSTPPQLPPSNNSAIHNNYASPQILMKHNQNNPKARFTNSAIQDGYYNSGYFGKQTNPNVDYYGKYEVEFAAHHQKPVVGNQITAFNPQSGKADFVKNSDDFNHSVKGEFHHGVKQELAQTPHHKNIDFHGKAQPAFNLNHQNFYGHHGSAAAAAAAAASMHSQNVDGATHQVPQIQYNTNQYYPNEYGNANEMDSAYYDQKAASAQANYYETIYHNSNNSGAAGAEFHAANDTAAYTTPSNGQLPEHCAENFLYQNSQYFDGNHHQNSPHQSQQQHLAAPTNHHPAGPTAAISAQLQHQHHINHGTNMHQSQTVPVAMHPFNHGNHGIGTSPYPHHHANGTNASMDNSNSSSDFNFLSNLANDFAPEYYQLS